MYYTWIDHVKASVPKEKLLIFKPNDGWEPLCTHLGLPVPPVPYPSRNDRRAFMKDTTQWSDFKTIDHVSNEAIAAAA